MKHLIAILSLFFITNAFSQNTADTIFKKNKEVLIVKITEIGIDEVKYKPIVNPNDIILVIEKSEIARIVFASGISQVFADPLKDKTLYADNHKNNIKFNFVSPVGDRIHFNLEHSTSPGMSYEVGINAIGIGRRFGQYTPVGAVVNAGFRFYRLPDMKNRSDRYSHIMNGAYFQPSVAFGMTQHHYRSYNAVDPYYDYVIKKANTNFMMFFLNFGKQYIFANRLSFDISAGIGYGTYTNQRGLNYNYYNYGEYGKDAYTYEDPTRYGFQIFSKEVPLALNAQFKLGYLFR